MLSAHDRLQLDFASPEYRASVQVLISQTAPIERRCRQFDWAIGALGGLAVLASLFVIARFGLNLIWLAVAIVNGLTLHRHVLRAIDRRREWAWLCDVCEYLIARDAVTNPTRRDLPHA